MAQHSSRSSTLAAASSCDDRGVARELELAVVAALREALPDAQVHHESPAWLMRPGLDECGARWELVCSIYRELTGLELPHTMPPRERRQVDAVIEQPGQSPRIFEFDESQHFNLRRAVTLHAYPPDVATAFPRDVWLRACEASTRKLGTTGGWGKAKPPLFPSPVAATFSGHSATRSLISCRRLTDGHRHSASRTSRRSHGSASAALLIG